MGLDMYLSKEEYVTYLGNDKDGNLKTVTDAVISVTRTYSDGTKDTVDIKTGAWDCGLVLNIPIGYWRKVNAIHNWFVENCADGVDDCRPIEICGDQLIKLRNLCQEVLNNRKKAADLLPTQKGFFFGSTEYDECYFDDLKDTIEMLKNIDEEAYYTYRASW